MRSFLHPGRLRPRGGTLEVVTEPETRYHLRKSDNETARTAPPPLNPTPETKSSSLQIVFLGLCEHIRQLREFNFDIFKFNILGLKTVVLLPFLPLPLPSSWYFVFAVRGLQSASNGLTIRLRILSEDHVELGYVTIGMATGGAGGQVGTAPAEENHVAYNGSIDGWGIVSLQVNAPIFFLRPGRYSIVRQTTDDTEQHIGEFYLAVVNAAPFTPEAIAAIRTDPLAIKSARMTLGCNECRAELGVFTSLDGRSRQLPEGFT